MSVETVEIKSFRELEIVLTRLTSNRGINKYKSELLKEMAMKFFQYGVQFQSNGGKVEISL